MAERKCCEPLVSIIIPVYNAGKFLKQCIESVIHQTYKNIEIILVNDGSTDKSGELCDAYAKKDVRIHVTHKENSGVVDARRIGSQQATGIYCTCVDSDDWISNDFVEKMMRIAETYHAPDWIACGYIQADEHGREIAAYPLELRKGYYSEEARVKEVLPCCITGKNGVAFSGGVVLGKLYKTELFRECQERVEPKLKYGEDFACATAVAYMCRTYYLMEDCMYYYRANPTSAVHVTVYFTPPTFTTFVRIKSPPVDVAAFLSPNDVF